MSTNPSADVSAVSFQPIEDKGQDLAQFLKPLAIDDEIVHSLAYQFSKVYRELALSSDVQFLPTPVTGLPAGTETGQFLAIDVGGTNLRVAFIELLGDFVDPASNTTGVERSKEAIRNAQRPRVRRTLEKAWPIGEHLKIDKTEDLFAWIGDCIAEVVGDYLANEAARQRVPEILDLGITFSFPMIQHELNSATLMPMGKGFSIHENLDLGSTLLEGYDRHTRRQEDDSSNSPRVKRRRLGPLPRLRIAAITNDTIATLCALAYSVKSLPNSRVAAGLIVGTGCNATIPWKFDALGEEKSRKLRQSIPFATETVLNTEFTIAGACGPLQAVATTWDKRLDSETARPGFQPLEYMTGGRYIGELIRIIFVDYMTNVHRPPVAAELLPKPIVENYNLTTTFVSAVVARARTDVELARELKHRMPTPEPSNWSWTPHAAGALRKVAQIVQIRSAGLIAAATAGLLASAGEIGLEIPSQIEADTNKENMQLDQSAIPIRAKASDNASMTPFQWNSGPEELVVAYTGGIIQHYPNFKEHCQRFLDKLIMRSGPQAGGRSVYLRESRDGGIIGAGVLAGMESLRSAASYA